VSSTVGLGGGIVSCIGGTASTASSMLGLSAISAGGIVIFGGLALGAIVGLALGSKFFGPSA
jgi:hypothetical protein